MDKAKLAGGIGTRTLFETVLLITNADDTAAVCELFSVCDRISFTGHYFQWDYVRAPYASAYDS